MWKIALLYALVLALAAAALQWLEYRYLTRAFSTELYVVFIAIGCVILGGWAGVRLTGRQRSGPFETNQKAIVSLGLTRREVDVLKLLADGQSNKEIARSLDISPNTVKTHAARIYEKLEVQSRTQAIRKARMLALIP